MKLHGFIKKPVGAHTNYYRSSVSLDDFRRAMDGKGPLSIIQIGALLGDSVPPEAKSRYADLSDKAGAGVTLIQKTIRGVRRIAQLRMRNLIKKGRVRKHGIGKEARYEWIENKDAPARQDSARRRHAKPRGTRSGRD